MIASEDYETDGFTGADSGGLVTQSARGGGGWRAESGDKSIETGRMQ
jgi:hypothetical protein